MPLGMEVGLGPGRPGDFMLDGDPAPPQKNGTAPRNFWPMSVVANGWMDQDATWYGGKPQTGDVVLDGFAQPPSFWLISIVAKRLDVDCFLG